MLQTILNNGTGWLQTCVPKDPVSAFGQIIRLNPLGYLRQCRRRDQAAENGPLLHEHNRPRSAETPVAR